MTLEAESNVKKISIKKWDVVGGPKEGAGRRKSPGPDPKPIEVGGRFSTDFSKLWSRPLVHKKKKTNPSAGRRFRA